MSKYEIIDILLANGIEISEDFVNQIPEARASSDNRGPRRY